MTKKKTRGAPKGNQNARTHGFYSKALTAAERIQIEECASISGLDEEIILLRMKLKDLVDSSPDRMDLHIAAANSIAKLVKIRYQITKDESHSLRDAISKVLTDVALPLGIGIGSKL